MLRLEKENKFYYSFKYISKEDVLRLCVMEKHGNPNLTNEGIFDRVINLINIMHNHEYVITYENDDRDYVIKKLMGV